MNGKDYLGENVEKASVWHEVYLQNMQLRGAGRDVETEMVWQRKYNQEEDYLRKRQEYQKRWGVFR
jgi:hypothetical protein